MQLFTELKGLMDGAEHKDLVIHPQSQLFKDIRDYLQNPPQDVSNLGRPKIMCLCGSTRFKEQFEAMNKRFTREGYIVLTVGWFGHLDDEPMSDHEKEFLDMLHREKIRRADEIFLINLNGYIGESTKSEVQLAYDLKKCIRYLEIPN